MIPDADPDSSEEYVEEDDAESTPELTQSQRAELFDSWVDDPVLFCNDVFKQQPREFQPALLRQIKESKKKRIAIKACRKAGKTALAAYLALWWLCTRPGSLVVTTAPTERQVKELLWTEIRKLWAKSILPQLFPDWQALQKNIVTVDPDWRALGVISDEADKLEGMHGTSVLVIYDESKAVPDDVYEAFQGMLSSEDGSDVEDWREVAISTPGDAVGWYYDAFTTNRRLWDCYTITGDQIPRLKTKYYSELDRLGPESPFFRRQQKAEFAGAETGSIIPLNFVEQCVNLGITRTSRWSKVFGLDVASGEGQAETVITFRYGPVVMWQKCFRHLDEMKIVNLLVKLFRQYQPERIVVDKPGIGGPVIKRLRELLDPDDAQGIILAFNPQERAQDDENFDNVKTELIYSLRERLKAKVISVPNDPTLIAQIASYRSAITTRGKTKVVDPPKSPDRADSLLIAFSPEFLHGSVAFGNPRI